MRSASAGCVPTMSCTQPGGSGSPSRRLREAEHDALERGGIARHLERLPVGLGLHPPRDVVRERRRRELEDRDDEQRERNRLRRAHAAAPARRPHEDPRAGDREEREPAEALREVPLRVVRELVREHDLLLVLGERLEQHRVPEDDAARRPDAVRVRVRLLGVVAHLLDPDRDVADARARARYSRAADSSASSRSGSVVKSRYGATNVKSAAIATNTAAPGSHQLSPSRRARPITMSSAMQIERNWAPRIAQSSNSQSR